MLGTTFSPWPSYTQEEIDAVANVLASNRVNYWTGTECRSFENEFAEFVGTEYAVALANGTVALDVALHALGIGPGHEVIVTSRSFIASASCIVTAGAKVVFADVDADSQNITAETIMPCLSPKTKAIICVHLAGWPCDMDEILALAKKHNIYVIEDCAQAHGARYKGRSVGSMGHIGAWSFCQDKIMTTGGEGGMVTTNDPVFYQKMWSYKDHGKSQQAIEAFRHVNGFKWLHEGIGTNWRMIEMQAVLGRIQLKLMQEWHHQRRKYAQMIWDTAKHLPGLRVPIIPDDVDHAAYKCYVFIEKEALAAGWSRDKILAEISAKGVPCYMGSCSEIYLEKAFESIHMQPKVRLPVAKELGETSLMFLVHPTLTMDEIKKTCDVLTDVMQMACAEAVLLE